MRPGSPAGRSRSRSTAARGRWSRSSARRRRPRSSAFGPRTSTRSGCGQPTRRTTRARTRPLRRSGCGASARRRPRCRRPAPGSLRENPSYLGGGALGAVGAGATATFAFTGSQVAWIATRAANRGQAAVALDGVPTTTVDLARSDTQYRRLVFGHAWPSSGPHTLTITVLGTPGHPYVDIDGLVVVDPPAESPVLVGAGDIAVCGLTGDSRTAALLDGIAGRVFAAGDLAYPDGTTGQFRDCYGPTWGRWRARTSPAPGNHEYHASGGARPTTPSSGHGPGRRAPGGTPMTSARGACTS